MAAEAGMTTRGRYHALLRPQIPTARKAAVMTVSWPNSTPTLKLTSAGTNCP